MIILVVHVDHRTKPQMEDIDRVVCSAWLPRRDDRRSSRSTSPTSCNCSEQSRYHPVSLGNTATPKRPERNSSAIQANACPNPRRSECQCAKPKKDQNRKIAPLFIKSFVTLGLTQRIPESLRAFCKIVSLTAAKTSRILDVSVA